MAILRPLAAASPSLTLSALFRMFCQCTNRQGHIWQHCRYWLLGRLRGGLRFDGERRRGTFGGNVGSGSPLGSLVVTGPTTLAGNITTADGPVRSTVACSLRGASLLIPARKSPPSKLRDSAPTSPGSSLTVTALDMFLNGALGGISPLGGVSLTSDFLTLPSISPWAISR